MGRSQRRNYAQVSSGEAAGGGVSEEGSFVNEPRRSSGTGAAEEGTEMITTTASAATATTSGRRRGGQQQRSTRYNRVAGGDEEQGLAAVSSSSSSLGSSSTAADCSSTKTLGLLNEDNDDKEESNMITVVVLDVAQKKFHVRVSPTAKVETLKLAGQKVHKVSPDRQRLIYRGKLLQDGATLQESGIVADETIVHLFPKPRVVIKDNANAEEENKQEDNESSNNNEEEGARVPTIVLDADEAERRSQILVLGSQDYLEAQNSVKLFSFMLLIISSIELMNLMFVAAGVPQEEGGGSMNGNGGFVALDDDIFPRGGGATANDDGWNNATGGNPGMEQLTVEPWRPRYTFDFIISVMGVYVGILGLQASTHNTLRLARWYLWGTCLTGMGWMIYNFIETYRIDQEVEALHEKDPHYTDVLYDDDDLFWQAVTVMVLPGMVWLMCALRAFQFQHLLMEAELEAEQRIRSEFAAVVRAVGGGGASSSDDVEAAAVRAVDTALPNHNEELVLQRASARIS